MLVWNLERTWMFESSKDMDELIAIENLPPSSKQEYIHAFLDGNGQSVVVHHGEPTTGLGCTPWM